MRTQRVDKVLVTSGDEAASVAALGAGDYVVLVEGKAANTPIEAGDKFQIVVGKQDGTVKYSDRIRANDIVSVRLEEYRPVVEQVATVDLGDPVAGLEYLLTIVDKSDKEVLQRRQDKRTYQIIAAADEDTASLTAKFAAAINDDPAAPVIATTPTGGPNDGLLVLTAKPKIVSQNWAGQFGLQHFFEVGVQEVNIYGHYVSFGTVAYPTLPDFGNGTYPHVHELEAYAAGYEDTIYLNRRKFPVAPVPFDSVAGTTYDIITIEFDAEYNTNSVVFGKRVADPITIVLAVEAGNTGDLETILDNYIVD